MLPIQQTSPLVSHTSVRNEGISVGLVIQNRIFPILSGPASRHERINYRDISARLGFRILQQLHLWRVYYAQTSRSITFILKSGFFIHDCKLHFLKAYDFGQQKKIQLTISYHKFRWRGWKARSNIQIFGTHLFIAVWAPLSLEYEVILFRDLHIDRYIHIPYPPSSVLLRRTSKVIPFGMIGRFCGKIMCTSRRFHLGVVMPILLVAIILLVQRILHNITSCNNIAYQMVNTYSPRRVINRHRVREGSSR